MRTLPLSEAKDKLSALIDETEATHEIITITRHGRPAAVLMAADDLESLHETLYWLSKPGIAESITQAEREYAANETTSGDDLRTGLGLPQQ
ncbi:MAG: type II toxin-antitoxin system Phd/YefM family antitoxin [Pseudonocardiaceae bacterium]